MVKNLLLLIAETMITSQERNLPSYLNCFEGLTSEKFPFSFPSFTFCSQWKKETNEEFHGYFEISIKNPEGNEFGQPLKDEMIMKQEVHRINVVYNSLRFETPGVYTFCVDIFDLAKNKICSAQKELSIKQGKIVKKAQQL